MKSTKKLAALVAAVTMLTSASYASAANEECTQFEEIASSWGIAYTRPTYGTNGWIVFADGNVSVNPLPYGMMNEGMIYYYCCYNGRIYYSTGPEGSSIPEPVKIYSCNMWGGDNQLLADNVEAFSNAFIVDNVLYYQEYASWSDYGPAGYNGGVYKINLGDYSWKKLVDGNGVSLHYCDGDYVYYSTGYGYDYGYDYIKDYAAVDTNGDNWTQINPNFDEYNMKVRGDKSYYISNNVLYEKKRNGGNVKKLASLPNGRNIISTITHSYIYYINFTSGYPEFAKVYRINR